MKITNEILVDKKEGIRVIEILNDTQENRTYDYYVMMPGFTMEYAYGIFEKDRGSDKEVTEEIQNIWNAGYFEYMETVEEYYDLKETGII